MPRILDQATLNERSQRLLKLLVSRYIRDGQPVGSRTLSRDPGLELSPASIRNIMADLEELGLIRAPHTSAGRVPTVRGYRMFVDSLLQLKPLDSAAEQKLRLQLMERTDDDQRLLTQTSSLLSELTHLAGIVMLPRRESMSLRQVEFLPLSNNRVLVILVLNEREVQNRIIHTSRAYSESELRQAANYLNEAFAGKDLSKVREDLLHEMRAARDNMKQTMEMILEVADQTFAQEQDEGDFVLSGQYNLMDVAELSNLEKLKDLFEVFRHKRDILHLLDEALNANGVQIFLGDEAGYQGLDDCSLVTSPYQVNGRVIGVLGVIGPTRMAYDRVIPVVDMTARLLGSALQQLEKS